MAEESIDLTPGLEAIEPGGVLHEAVEQAEPASMRGVDGSKAAMKTIKLDNGITVEGRRPKFEAFSGDWWDAKHLRHMRVLALAYLALQEDIRTAEVGLDGVQVPKDVLDPAVKLREGMCTVLEYVCHNNQKVLDQVADIRKGSGYLDLISDLGRLARLYREHHITLSRDQVRYQAEDAQGAQDAAGRIRAELTKAGVPDRTVLRERAARVFGLLQFAYEEVAAAGRFLWRHEDGETRFPPLRVLMLG
jgi:hypothetical protein